ncbi:MAG: glycosyltransferase [Chloroflexi bacterium]|nr:glycosyltransferase [Chloroflexota bacterium]
MAIRLGRSNRIFEDPSAGKPIPSLTASSFRAERLWSMLPFAISITLASSVFWGPFAAPQVLAIGLGAFLAYWVIRSYAVVVACAVGLRRIGRWKKANWVARYCEWLPGHPEADAWDWPRHMVIIPNYKETDEGLSRTLDSLAAQPNANQLVVVMAMEAREPGSRAKASRLVMRYRARFGEMFATYHPTGLPNETPGKGSNEAWAAREAHIRLIEDEGDDIRRYSITSCDADAVFHPRHFEALNYLFLTAGDRYRTFWQPTIFNSNNIWDIPAPLRIMDGLSGINRLSNLVLPGSVKFPTSCYSVSWQMLTEVDYWDEEVIPEDWHIYLKCCFTLGDRVNVVPLYLPLGNDCVLTDSYRKTMNAHYAQSVRHAWGASDIPYAWRASMNGRTPLSPTRRFFLAGAVTKVHSLWVAQWYLITLGARLPGVLHAQMPGWWGAPIVTLPGPGWNVGALIRADFSHAFNPWLSLSPVGTLFYFCLFPLIALIIIEMMTRPKRPSYVSFPAFLGQFVFWPLMAVVTFFWASLPALHAQWKMASGQGLIYRVAEKGSRRVAVPAPATHGSPVPELAAEAEYGTAAGGGA